MNSLKSHVALILALVSILISIFLFRLFNDVLHQYQQNILNNYSIVIVSEKELNRIDIKEIDKIEKIDISKQLNYMKRKFKNLNLDSIKMPYFYKLKLKTLPSPNKLNEIEGTLKSYPYIKRVLTYRSSQTKIYNLLMLLKITSNLFMIIIAVLGFLLIVKQLEVWKLQHNERMYIMELFGAPFWFRGAALFKIAFIDSIIALISTFALIWYMQNSVMYKTILSDLNITLNMNMQKEFLILLVVSLSISLISSIVVVIGRNR
ncbi:FtsX-like permease family protein [Nautilia lithotrophica]